MFSFINCAFHSCRFCTYFTLFSSLQNTAFYLISLFIHSALFYDTEANKSAFPIGCIWLTNTQVLQIFEVLLLLLFFFPSPQTTTHH